MSNRFERLELEDAELDWAPDFVLPGERAALFAALHAEIAWERHVVRLFGREVPAPRLSCWIGDPGTSYTYSRVRFEPRPWTPALARVRERAAEACGEPFNSVLANLYRDGRDSMGFHSDAEPELGPEPVIASVSLGAGRRFVLQHRKRREQCFEIALTDGSLLVMRGTTQRYWRHAVPRTAKPVGARINLTFRRILPT